MVGLQLPLAPRLVEESQPETAGRVADHRGHHAAPIAQRHTPHVAHLHQHHGFDPFNQILDMGFVGAVDVTPWIRSKQVEHTCDARFSERFTTLFTDTLDLGDVNCRQVAVRERRFGAGRFGAGRFGAGRFGAGRRMFRFGHAAPKLLHAEEIRVQRLAAAVHLTDQRRKMRTYPLDDLLGRGWLGVNAGDDGEQLAVSRHDVFQQRS